MDDVVSPSVTEVRETSLSQTDTDKQVTIIYDTSEVSISLTASVRGVHSGFHNSRKNKL